MVGSELKTSGKPVPPTPWVIFALLLVGSLIIVFVVAWFVPAWFTSHDGSGLILGNDVEILKERNAVRTTLLQGVAGVFLLAGAVVAWRQMTEGARQARAAEAATSTAQNATAEQIKLAKSSQDATAEQIKLAKSSTRYDQMSRAITALGDESVAVRVGGVFALEQAMEELDVGARPSADLLAPRGIQEDGIYTLASLVRTYRPKDPSSAKPRAGIEAALGSQSAKGSRPGR